jgi:hypothetical protein
MVSVKHIFEAVTFCEPNLSSLFCFIKTIKGRRFSRSTIKYHFPRLVDSGDYDEKDKTMLLRHFYKVTNLNKIYVPITKLSASVRNCAKYHHWRDAVLKRDVVCGDCGSDQNLDVHHVKPFIQIIRDNFIQNMEEANKCSELWDVDNGVVLCRKCHEGVHGRVFSEKVPVIQAKHPQILIK